MKDLLLLLFGGFGFWQKTPTLTEQQMDATSLKLIRKLGQHAEMVHKDTNDHHQWRQHTSMHLSMLTATHVRILFAIFDLHRTFYTATRTHSTFTCYAPYA